MRYVVARYAPMNVTWQGVERFEEYADGRALLKEIGPAALAGRCNKSGKVFCPLPLPLPPQEGAGIGSGSGRG